jgi:uncharacterized protein (DUF58 family)
MALTGRTALLSALAALAVGLLAPGWPGVLAADALIALLCACDIALAAPVRQLSITRAGDANVRLGDGAATTLTVANPSRRPLRAELRDAWPPSSLGPDPSGVTARHRLHVPPGERRRAVTRLRPTRRGDHAPDRVTVRSYGPLGLLCRQGGHAVPGMLRVLPPFHSRRHLRAKLARLRELDGRTSALTRGEGTEFDGLRDYVPGDDTRSIDWRATARQSSVAVRTWRPERDRRILLVLDTGRTSAGRVGDAPRLDAAVEAALLLAALASRAGDGADLVAFDREVRALVQGRSSGDVLPAMAHAMTGVEPVLVETDTRALAATALRVAARRSLIVLFTSLDAAPFEAGLLPVLPQLTRRHTVLVASVADPHIAAMAASRGAVEAVYEAAAAVRAQEERLRIAQQLRRHGVHVVDAVPGSLPPQLADAYLALKSSGRL